MVSRALETNLGIMPPIDKRYNRLMEIEKLLKDDSIPEITVKQLESERLTILKLIKTINKMLNELK